MRHKTAWRSTGSITEFATRRSVWGFGSDDDEPLIAASMRWRRSKDLPAYPSRSTTLGSTRVARCAGKNPAPAATTNNNAIDPTKLVGSDHVTPNSIPLSAGTTTTAPTI